MCFRKFNRIFHERHQTMKKNDAKFTLIELLVVIAIIAILAAILMPALQSALERGRQSTCKSNWKQVWLAWSMYRDDNRHPMILWDGNKAYIPDNEVRSPVVQLAPYFNSGASSGKLNASKAAQRYFLCPSAKDPEEDAALSRSAGSYRCHLGFNEYGVWYEGFSPWGDPSKANFKSAFCFLNGMCRPSVTMLFCDAREDSYKINTTFFSGANRQSKMPNILRHNKSSNVIFLDGHCESRNEAGFHIDSFNVAPVSPDDPGNVFWGYYQYLR